MPLLLLLCLSLGCLPIEWPVPYEGFRPRDSALGTAAVLAALAASAAYLSWTTRRRLARSPERYAEIALRFGRGRHRHTLLLAGAYVAILYGLGWGWAVQQFCGNSAWPGCELLILLPLPVGLVLAWVCFYDGERALRGGGEGVVGRWGYVLLNLRQQMALLLPPLLLLALNQGVARAFPRLPDWALAAAALGLLAGLVLLMPMLARPLLGGH